MATQPHPTAPPPKPAPQPAPPKPEPPAAKVEAHQAKAPDPHPDGPNIADLQRESSAKIEAEGMAKYLEAIDERPAGERTNKQVPGVTPPTKRE